MVKDIPLGLKFLVDDLSQADVRVKIYQGTSTVPTNPGWAVMAVPLGSGHAARTWDDDGIQPVLFCKGLRGPARGPWFITAKNISKITTIRSHTPGRIAKELWRADWYTGP